MKPVAALLLSLAGLTLGAQVSRPIVYLSPALSPFIDLAAAALHKDQALSSFSGFVQDSGEGRWTIEAAIEEAVPADVLSASLYARFRSRQEHTFGEKVLSAMRFAFGGHVETPKGGGAPR